MPAATPIGTATKKVTIKTRLEPTQADKIPAPSALRDGKLEKKSKFILGNTLILIPYSMLLVLIPDGLGLVYTIIASVSGGLMLVYHYKLTKTPTSEFAWKAYKVTAPYLTIIFVAVALDAAFHFPLT